MGHGFCQAFGASCVQAFQTHPVPKVQYGLGVWRARDGDPGFFFGRGIGFRPFGKAALLSGFLILGDGSGDAGLGGGVIFILPLLIARRIIRPRITKADLDLARLQSPLFPIICPRIRPHTRLLLSGVRPIGGNFPIDARIKLSGCLWIAFANSQAVQAGNFPQFWNGRLSTVLQGAAGVIVVIIIAGDPGHGIGLPLQHRLVLCGARRARCRCGTDCTG